MIKKKRFAKTKKWNTVMAVNVALHTNWNIKQNKNIKKKNKRQNKLPNVIYLEC